METIHKYKIVGSCEIEIPIHFRILTLQLQKGEPFVWLLVDTDMPKKRVMFHVIVTGVQVPNNTAYVGTFQLDGGNLVYHVFVKLG